MKISIDFDPKNLEKKKDFDVNMEKVKRQIIVGTMANHYFKYPKDDAFCANELMLIDCRTEKIISEDIYNELSALNRSMNVDGIHFV